MIKISGTRHKLITLLADGEFHSGEVLGEALGITRMAVSKQIKVLESIGIDIYKVSGKGYRLSNALQLLDAQYISDSAKVTVETHQILPSTNQHLLDKAALLKEGHTCFAEYQTAGRGRRGKKWVSPYGSHLYVSTYWCLEAGVHRSAGLSLAIGIAVARTLQGIGIQGASLKWPNDVYVQGKKIAGILVEIIATAGGECHLVIGLGLNVRMPLRYAQEIDQAWTDISLESPNDIDRNELASQYLQHLIVVLKQFEQEGFTAFVDEWNSLDAFKNADVELVSGHLTKSGVAKGIDKNGSLLLEIEGVLTTQQAGDMSLKRRN